MYAFGFDGDLSYIFAVTGEGKLSHCYNGFYGGEVEDIGGREAPRFSGKPAVIGGQADEDSPPNRIDIVVLGEDTQCYHVSGTGLDSWDNWTCHGGKFRSAPEIVSWAIDKWEIIGGSLQDFPFRSSKSVYQEL